MSLFTRAAAALLATTAVVAVASTASAQDFKPKSAGDIVVRARALGVVPDESGKVMLNGTSNIGNVRIDNDYIPELDFSYFITDNIALELIAGTTRHRVSSDLLPALGGRTEVSKVSLLPPTLTVQYHPLPKERVSPYVGAGINWTYFYNQKAANNPNPGGVRISNIDYENSFGWALQAGVDIAISGAWSLNLDVKKVFLDTKVKGLANGALPWSSKVDIDPWLVGVGVGYRF